MKKFLWGLVWLWLLVIPVKAAQLNTRIISSNNTYSTDLLTQKTDLQIGVSSDTSVPNGKFEILLYASDSSALADDGAPDYNAFDLAGVTVNCPTSISGVFDFGVPIVQPADVANRYYYEGYYHVVTCPYTGTGEVSQANFGWTNNNYFQILQLINPKNDPNLPNSQLIYSPIWVRQLDQYGNPALGQLQTVTSSRNVQMLATVSPQISFVLEGLPAGGSYCGLPNKNTTTGTLANFGTITPTAFSDIAQRLRVSTNANNGYVVTAVMDDQMRLEGGPPIICTGDGMGNDACLPSAQVPGMSATVTQPWTSVAQGPGLAFTMENATGADNVFDYSQGYRLFADEESSDAAAIILTTPTGKISANYLCYRLVPTSTNLDGTYSNNVTYTITASF